MQQAPLPEWQTRSSNPASSITTRAHPHTASADTRHTYVTRLIESGYDAGFVSEQVGHSHAATTAIYTALSSEYKNLQVRQHLEAAEAEVPRLAFAQADLEAECDEKLASTLALQDTGSRRGA
ncbi:site-specific integrase [Streptomyces sp. BE147]|uniref:site-specific integrase n=1 Tax=Streptomyces sp. BE147 TaxID=3002524 RepID=UPI002E778E84|nr:site-specific integrase [Streptomyces sp. BE147]MEE1735343.1 site-specific integrase [Streptomyces sp. BE147]